MTDSRISRCHGWAAVLVVAALGVVTGCSGANATNTAAPTVVSSAATAAPQLPPPGTFRLTGALKEPGELTVEKLKGMPQHTVPVNFQAGKGPEQHTEVGVLLSELVPPSALATQQRKNDLLSFALLAIGADGYAALVAYGEVSPDFGNKDILLAGSQDGQQLERPRLIVPGDVKGGRYVTDVVELHVARVGAG